MLIADFAHQASHRYSKIKIFFTKMLQKKENICKPRCICVICSISFNISSNYSLVFVKAISLEFLLYFYLPLLNFSIAQFQIVASMRRERILDFTKMMELKMFILHFQKTQTLILKRYLFESINVSSFFYFLL